MRMHQESCLVLCIDCTLTYKITGGVKTDMRMWMYLFLIKYILITRLIVKDARTVVVKAVSEGKPGYETVRGFFCL